jgi:prepilin-type N-terminal cleavage/methylation domain-containing protein/prepilin-type processing-associated H-X9-DG protein
MMHLKKAFTLIELLVVIAIIAILAAILFPVFAQAKIAAKGAASESNVKQQALAILMYCNDYDDFFPLDETWGDQTAPFYYSSWPAGAYTMWSEAILPYEKNNDIDQDPLTMPNAEDSSNWEPSWLFKATDPEYGYNYSGLSPYIPTGATAWQAPWVRTPVSATQKAKPAQTVMLGGDTANSEVHSRWWWGVGTKVTQGMVEGPDCNDINPMCTTNWGQGSWWTYNMYNNNVIGGCYTAGLTVRKSNQSNTAFCDGHAKFQAAEALATSTNFSWQIQSSQITFTDKTKDWWGATEF